MRRPSSNGAVEVEPPAAAGAAVEGPTLRTLGELETRLLQWQWANAEYGNSACLDKVG